MNSESQKNTAKISPLGFLSVNFGIIASIFGAIYLLKYKPFDSTGISFSRNDDFHSLQFRFHSVKHVYS